MQVMDTVWGVGFFTHIVCFSYGAGYGKLIIYVNGFDTLFDSTMQGKDV